MSKFSEYVNVDSMKPEEVEKASKMLLEFLLKKVRENRIRDYMSKVFQSVEIKDKAVSHLVINPQDYSMLRDISDGAFSEATYRDLLESNTFGWLWTATIHVSRKADEPRVYSEDGVEQMKTDFPGILNPVVKKSKTKSKTISSQKQSNW